MIYNQTVISPLAITVLALAVIYMFIVQRHKAFLPVIIAGVLISTQQRVVIAGADFTILRLLVIFCLLRVLIRGEHRSLNFLAADKLMILWAVSRTLTYTILWQTSGAFINRIGGSLDALGIYFLARILVKTPKDIDDNIRYFLFVCLPLAFSMLNEWNTGRNLFSFLGGVPDITMVRDGRLRCQGPFQHPITAGTFGASLVPIFYIQLQRGKSKILYISAIVCGLTITATSSSSGPVLTLLAGVGGLFFWLVRNHMQAIRWATICMLAMLHIIMEGPVWALLMRVKVFGGSTGYHRFLLLDEFIRRIPEWFFFGVHSTAGWGHFGMNLWDVTNHYIRTAVDGGFSTLLIFVLILAFCFKSVGIVAHNSLSDKNTKLLAWGLGASLFSHSVSFMGVSYFDQIIIPFYATLAFVTTLQVNFPSPKRTESTSP